MKRNNRVLQDWSLFLYLSKTFPKHYFILLTLPRPVSYKHTERQAAAAGSYNTGLIPHLTCERLFVLSGEMAARGVGSGSAVLAWSYDTTLVSRISFFPIPGRSG